jgi:hypothetical protein
LTTVWTGGSDDLNSTTGSLLFVWVFVKQKIGDDAKCST